MGIRQLYSDLWLESVLKLPFGRLLQLVYEAVFADNPEVHAEFRRPATGHPDGRVDNRLAENW